MNYLTEIVLHCFRLIAPRPFVFVVYYSLLVGHGAQMLIQLVLAGKGLIADSTAEKLKGI